MKNLYQEKKDKLKLERTSIEFNMLKNRILATSIDIIIVVPILAILIIPFDEYITGKRGILSNELYDYHLYFLFFNIAFILYGSLLESSKYKGTIGQILFNVRILGKNSKRLSFPKALLRNFIKLYSFPLLFTFYIYNFIVNSIIIPAFDKIAGVKVMRRNERDEDIF